MGRLLLFHHVNQVVHVAELWLGLLHLFEDRVVLLHLSIREFGDVEGGGIGGRGSHSHWRRFTSFLLLRWQDHVVDRHLDVLRTLSCWGFGAGEAAAGTFLLLDHLGMHFGWYFSWHYFLLSLLFYHLSILLKDRHLSFSEGLGGRLLHHRSSFLGSFDLE